MSRFIREGTLLRHLKVLDGLGKYKRPTQQQLAGIVGVSPAMVNNYLAEFLRHGYVQRHGDSGRAVWYELTEKGMNHRDRLLIDYSSELIDMYRAAVVGISERVKALFGDKRARIVACPAGDTTRVLVNVISDFPNIELRGILDDSLDKQRAGCLGYRVTAFETLRQIECDGVLIATVALGDVIRRRVQANVSPGHKIWSLF